MSKECNKDHIIHHDHGSISEKKLFVTILLNVAITISEIIGGVLSGSLALLSDAFHNLADVFSLFISYIAIQISKKDKDNKKSFGYKRAEIIAAFFNVTTLVIAVIYILYEATKRLFNPQPINTVPMLIITFIGLLGNALSILILIKDKDKSINIRSAFLHLLGDTLSSVGVLIVAIILFLFPKLYFLDTLISILIAVYILKESFSIFFESINILMQGTPKGIEVTKIIKRLKEEKSLRILDIHHVHIWGLSSNEIIFDCHIVLPKIKIEQINKKLKIINEILTCEFDISHSTIQIEFEGFDHSTKCKL